MTENLICVGFYLVPDSERCCNWELWVVVMSVINSIALVLCE